VINSLGNCVKINWMGKPNEFYLAVAKESQLQVPAYLYDYNGDASLQWHIIWAAAPNSDSCLIASLLSGLNLGSMTAAEGQVVQMSEMPASWRVEWVDRRNSICKLVSRANEALVLAVNPRYEARHQTPVTLMAYQNAPAFHWKLEPLGL
jgi:hypothetical protein